jgi:DNA-binding response OmpR family regulator
MDGYRFCRQIPFVLLTEQRTPVDILKGLEHGALPGLDGLALTRRLKADPATRDITIVALTAYAMKGDEEKALVAGCDGYIAKPINTRTLPGVVVRYLNRSAVAGEGAA